MAGRERLGRTGMREAGVIDRRAGGSAGQVGARQGRKGRVGRDGSQGRDGREGQAEGQKAAGRQAGRQRTAGSRDTFKIVFDGTAKH